MRNTHILSGPSTERRTDSDPLGMQTGSINIYQKLLPGISNVTLRIRYYGLVCVACSFLRKGHR